MSESTTATTGCSIDIPSFDDRIFTAKLAPPRHAPVPGIAVLAIGRQQSAALAQGRSLAFVATRLDLRAAA